MGLIQKIVVGALAISTSSVLAQSAPPRPKFDSFEVATIKPVESEAKSGRYIKMDGTNRFVEKDYTLKLLIAAAYDLNPRTISGGPDWVDSDHYDILAVTPGEVRPDHDEQMSMLRNLLTERVNLKFHREPKVFSIYELQVAKDGLFDRHVGQDEIVGDVILVHLSAHKWQAVEALGHGCEGKAVGCRSVEERTFAGVIAGQEEMLFLLVPDCKAEGAGKMVNALFVPPLPRR